MPEQTQPDEDQQPSTSYQEWLWAHRQQGTYPEDTERIGKWIQMLSTGSVDKWWAKVKQATEDGRLGSSAKVGTLFTKKLSPYDRHALCVYTYDGLDRDDVMRVREELRALGLTQRMPYKLDSETLAGRYAHQGDDVWLYRE